MAKTPPKKQLEEHTPMPFDDALRVILKAKPQPMPTRKKSKRALSKRTR